VTKSTLKVKMKNLKNAKLKPKKPRKSSLVPLLRTPKNADSRENNASNRPNPTTCMA